MNRYIHQNCLQEIENSYYLKKIHTNQLDMSESDMNKCGYSILRDHYSNIFVYFC